MRGKIVQLNISPGGLPKTPILQAEVGPLGIMGDLHRSRHHGGPKKALLLIASEFVELLRQEAGRFSTERLART